MTDYVEIFVARGDKGTSFDSLLRRLPWLITVTLIYTVRQTGNYLSTC